MNMALTCCVCLLVLHQVGVMMIWYQLHYRAVLIA